MADTIPANTITQIVNTQHAIFQFQTDTASGIDVADDGLPVVTVDPPSLGTVTLVAAEQPAPGRFAVDFVPAVWGETEGTGSIEIVVDADRTSAVRDLTRSILIDVITPEASVINVSGLKILDVAAPTPAPAPAPAPAPTPTPAPAVGAAAIVASQVPVSGTALLINGSAAVNGVATLSPARPVVMSFGNEAAVLLMTLTGTGANGAEIDETLTVTPGAAGTITSTNSFATVTMAFPAGGTWTQPVAIS